jgi:Tfp pilus assembly protein PilX
MRRHTGQRGAALILMLAITATLAILASTLVFVIANEQRATANVRLGTRSVYAADTAIETGVVKAQVASPMPTVAPASEADWWLDTGTLESIFANSYPAGVSVEYDFYDNLSPVVTTTKYDSNADKRMWVQATVTYTEGNHTKKTCERVLVEQSVKPFAAALPAAVTYSDTGIKLLDSSDIYAVNADGSPWTSSTHLTQISGGGTWLETMPSSYAEVGRITLNASSDLKGPGSTKQGLGMKANGSISVNGTVYTSAGASHQLPPASSNPTYTDVTIGPRTIGILSDYFDSAAQESLQQEAQEGGTPAPAPTASPASWTSTGYTAITGTTTTGVLGTLMSTTSTTTYTATTDLVMPSTLNSGNLVLSRGTNTTGRTFNFQDLYVAGNLTLTGPVTVNATSLYVGGTITINNATTTTVSDSFGPLRLNGTGSSSVAGRVNLTTSAVYTGGALSISNTTTTALTDNLGSIYAAGNFSVSGPVTLNAPSYLYVGGDATLTGPSSGTTTDQFGLIYTSGTTKTLTFSGNVQVKATAVTANGDFTISGATAGFTDWLGAVYVAFFSSSSQPSLNHGDINWSGTVNVTSRDYTQQADPNADVAQPKPMWMGRYWSRSGTYNDEYGNIWVPGNSSTSISLGCTGNSTIMCPLLATTEKTQISGHLSFGTRTKPMVWFYICDNNGIYPQVLMWGSTGTYYGLIVCNESTMDIYNGVAGTPSIEGAVFAGCPYDPTYTSGMSKSDIVLEDGSSIAYNQAVVGAVSTSSLKTTTMVTETVQGSWQQLPVD